MPSLATSEVEPTASAPSAPAGELATAAMATNATTQPSFIISPSKCCGIRRLAALLATDNRASVSPVDYLPAAFDEHQRDPLIERDARRQFQSLHPVGGDRRWRLRGEQAGQDHVPGGREHARDRRGEPPQRRQQNVGE